MRNVDPLKRIKFDSTGAGAIGGTFAGVIGGAAPGVPPRGAVRTTWLGGNGVPSRKCRYMRFTAWTK